MKAIQAFLLVPIIAALAASWTPAQTCPGATATLTVSPTNCVSTGSIVSVQLCGNRDAMAMIMSADAMGTMNFPGHMPMLNAFTLCLQNPSMFTMGFTDGSGCMSQSWVIPPGIPSGSTIYLQGMLMTMNMGSGGHGTGGHGTGGGHGSGGGHGTGQPQMQLQTSDVAQICFL